MLFQSIFEIMKNRRKGWGSVGWGNDRMLRTIALGTCVSVQGLLVSKLADGKIVVRVDGKNFVGYPVASLRKT